jgi:cytochrome c oxidase subunit 2
MKEAYYINDWLRRILFLPPQSSTVAESIDHLHYLVIGATMAGACGVAMLAFYYTIRYRRRAIHAVTPPRETVLPTPLWLEGAMITGIFSIFFAFWVIGFAQYTRLRIPPKDTYDIYVTAKQWMWSFSYVEGNHSISQLYVPAGRPVNLIMTSRDVIHSFFVPDFRLKQDVLPGRYTTLWFEVKEPGRHQVLCAEFCGTNHSTMRAEVIALSPRDFARWLEAGRRDTNTPAPHYVEPAVALDLGPSKPMSMERLGEAVAAEQGCLRCHTLDGSDHIGPSWAGAYMATIPLASGGTVVADEAYLTESMMDPLAKIRRGYTPVMPSYLGRLQPAEVSAIVQLIKSLRSLPGEIPRQPQSLAPERPPAGAIGQQPGQPELPLLQHVPRGIEAPPPAEQGLPPPGARVLPPMQGTVRVGPKGPEGLNREGANPEGAKPEGAKPEGTHQEGAKPEGETQKGGAR